ncbi:MAG: hypothetical protein ACI9W6_000722 [Motiliproteus sp.]|jgi:uncharacterized protein (TIGR02466 family)
MNKWQPLMAETTQLTVYHQDLFPTRVWTVDLGALASYRSRWIDIIKQMQSNNPNPAGRSNRLGWNSEPTLFNDQRFAPLAEAASGVVDLIFKEMGPPDFPNTLEAWANVHGLSGYNTIHNHAGALLSACYYLSVPPNSGALVLRDPRPGAMLSPWQGSLRPNGGSEIAITPQQGQLIVFPNWLEHGAEAHAGSEARISIPINVVLKR